MSKHKCEGLDLWACCDHPKWRAARGGSEPYWYTIAPRCGMPHTIHDTHADAVQYATSRARAEALAAVQSAEGVTAR